MRQQKRVADKEQVKVEKKKEAEKKQKEKGDFIPRGGGGRGGGRHGGDLGRGRQNGRGGGRGGPQDNEHCPVYSYGQHTWGDCSINPRSRQSSEPYGRGQGNSGRSGGRY